MGLFDDIFAGDTGVAKILVDELSGVTGAVTVLTPGTYDPATDTQLAGSSTDVSVSASPPLKYKKSEIDGTSILRGDSFVIIPASDLVVDFFNNMSKYGANGETFTIIMKEEIWSGDEISAYKLQLRK